MSRKFYFLTFTFSLISCIAFNYFGYQYLQSYQSFSEQVPESNFINFDIGDPNVGLINQMPINIHISKEAKRQKYVNNKDSLKESRIFDTYSGEDRIVEQIAYVPRNYHKAVETKKPKIILSYPSLRGLPEGDEKFKLDKCAVDLCSLKNYDKEEVNKTDSIVFHYEPYGDNYLIMGPKDPNQVWILYNLESPVNTVFSVFRSYINWTATYRTDSTLVTPYAKWVPFKNIKQISHNKTNYAAGKTKMVAWFVSNCNTENQRLQYALDLAEYIDVDIYGDCGVLQCSRDQRKACFQMLNKDYKFYLSFENSNCKDYITEKFFVNGLSNDVIPIVMGATRESYIKAAPHPHSFIHVEDFKSPAHLAEYLHLLDKNDTLYNEYFTWKGTGEFIDTKFWCRLCAMLHIEDHVTWYEDVGRWWDDPEEPTCVTGRWDKTDVYS